MIASDKDSVTCSSVTGRTIFFTKIIDMSSRDMKLEGQNEVYTFELLRKSEETKD